jgi:hypothetical protein
VRLMWEDQARLGRISDPRRCWAPPGVRPEVNNQLVREYEYAFAAVNPQDGALDTLVLPAVHTEARNVFLAEVSARHPHQFILMVWDRAGRHRAKRLPVPSHMRLIPLYAAHSSAAPESPVESGGACLGGSAREVVCEPSIRQYGERGAPTRNRSGNVGSRRPTSSLPDRL